MPTFIDHIVLNVEDADRLDQDLPQALLEGDGGFVS